MNPSVEKAVGLIDANLIKFIDEGYAQALKEEIPSPLTFYGIKQRKLKEIATEFVRINRHRLDEQFTLQLVDKLWTSLVREHRITGIYILGMFPNMIEKLSWNVLERWIMYLVDSEGCDILGIEVVGKNVVAHPQRHFRLEELADAEDPWHRRLAIISTLPFLRQSEPDPTFCYSIAKILLGDKEANVRKATGRALKEAIRVDAMRGREFVMDNINKINITLFKEILPVFPPKEQKVLSKAYQRA